jgi:hypothetical protein
MARKKTAPPEKPTHINCPFSIIVDTQEKKFHRYTFSDIKSNADNGHLPFKVDIVSKWLDRLGDYSLILPPPYDNGPKPRCIVERKSKEDFFGSMAKRDNWEERLARMCEEVECPAVIVESEWSDIFDVPAAYSHMNPTTMHRTVQSWTIEYAKVHWFFYPGREAAEIATFWYLYRFYEKVKKFETDKLRQLTNYEAYFDGLKANRMGVPVDENPHPRTRTIGDLADFWSRGWIDAQDIHSAKNKGNRKCSEPPTFPDIVFSRDYARENGK